ncbi:MAG TPA: glucosamine-6-phosphate deaminase [Vicinamibacterales bacterium]
MQIRILPDSKSLGQQAAADAAQAIGDAVAARGHARIIAATGASQFHFLEALTALPGVPWSQVEIFHLDEYIGLPVTHPASFRRYLHERLVDKVRPARFHALDGEGDPVLVCQTVGRELASAPIDVAFVGIGENAHLAFNDPPADFETTEPYIVVTLDEACRRQQVGEGWFPSIADVPERAISMSVHQILQSRRILCIVPDRRKAEAVRASVEGPVTPQVPASILQTHPDTTLYLDPESASLLRRQTRG